MNEKAWVQSWVTQLNAQLQSAASDPVRVTASASQKLPYACEIQGYRSSAAVEPVTASYETDVLIRDVSSDGSWVPRVVVECKLGSITTHDALTYSTKAATHKHVHPYLRYGILLGGREHYALPGRLVRHGAYFDFMLSWQAGAATAKEWQTFCELIMVEVHASRDLQTLLTTTRLSSRNKYQVLHRKLVLR